MKKLSLLNLCLASAGLIGFASSAKADYTDVIYGNNASFGPDIADKYTVDVTTGTAVLDQAYTVGTGNGRGMVVVGNIMYTTQVGDNHIYETDATTGLPIGSIATAQASMSTIAWDGSEFWTSDYAGSAQAYRINLAGVTTQTITLGTGAFKDGLEYFNGKLIANEGDAQDPYDVYDLNGNLITPNFINAAGTTGNQDTGIAYDGTYFFTSEIFNSALDVWDSSGNYVKTIGLPPGGNSYGPNLFEDLSVNYATRADTGGAPDSGSTLGLLSMACVLGGALKRRFASK